MKRTLKQIFSIICLCSTSLAYAQTSHSDSVLQHKACFAAAKLELEGMLQGKVKPSFERAIFLIENAFYGNEFDYAVFQQVLDQQEADIRLMKETKRSLLGEKLIKYDPSIWKRAQQTPEQRSVALENLLANWAIYAYMKDTVILAMKDGLRFIVHQKPYAYSRSDPMGTADWRNTQVTHLIAHKEGNCFALAALYKILAERLETDALLATAPSHIFIRHADEEGRMYNVELSNNSFPGSGTMETLTYTTKEATQNNIAMRNLSQEQSIALCLVYLAKGYEQVFNINSDPIVMNCAQTALQYDSLNLNALLLKSEVLQDRLVAQNKSIALLKNEKDFKELELLTSKLYKLGYREMPLEMKNFLIQRWTQDSSAILVRNNYAYQPPTVSGVSPTRYASLSWGLFDEEIPVKDIERYGRFLFDTKTHKITVIAPTQSLYNHYSFDPVAFAMNVDPMAHKFPHASPYNFVENNPISRIDPDGNEWVNARQKDVDRLGKALIDNPNSKKIQREMKNAISMRDDVNNVMNNLRKNDRDLYNYIDNLKVNIFGKERNVKVEVDIDYRVSGNAGQLADTRHINSPDFTSEYKNTTIETPYMPSKKNAIGFQITLYDGSDASLANESGDVMYYMEYNKEAVRSGSDEGKSYGDYMRKGGAGEYSDRVETKYKARSKEVKANPQVAETRENPYPLPNSTPSKK
jgi:hypothetical protein